MTELSGAGKPTCRGSLYLGTGCMACSKCCTELVSTMSGLVGYVSTVPSQMSDTWANGLVDRLNRANQVMQSSVRYEVRPDCVWPIKEVE